MSQRPLIQYPTIFSVIMTAGIWAALFLVDAPHQVIKTLVMVQMGLTIIHGFLSRYIGNPLFAGQRRFARITADVVTLLFYMGWPGLVVVYALHRCYAFQ